MDWKDTLASLTGLPEGEPEETKEPEDVVPSKRETLHVVMEKKGRGGKTATIVEGFQCSDDEVDEIARDLRKRLGTGGSARGGEILIQGDRRTDVTRLLREKGFSVK